MQDTEAPLLTYQQRGAAIRNSGVPSPIVGLPEAERSALLRDVLVRALNGETQASIAAGIGVHQTALSQALLRYCEDEWREVQVARAWTNVEQAEEAFADIEKTPDMTAIIRAEKRLKSAQWQLERLHRRLFGADMPSAIGATSVVVNIGLQREPVDVEQRSEGVSD